MGSTSRLFTQPVSKPQMSPFPVMTSRSPNVAKDRSDRGPGLFRVFRGGILGEIALVGLAQDTAYALWDVTMKIVDARPGER